MKKIITYSWVAAGAVATILIMTILLNGRDLGEILQSQATKVAPSLLVSTSRLGQARTVEKWDLVVLGRIDACFVCQRGSPHVSYTRVLAGKVPNGQTPGELSVAQIAPRLFSEGGVPIYESQQEEIVLLKRTAEHNQTDKNQVKPTYGVVDVMKATPQNVALFHAQ
jgi:hypothetical protein